MIVPIQVAIHPSQFPEQVRADLWNSLRGRQINHKFHYDSYRQTRKWLELHQAYAPSRNDPDCAACYDAGFATVSKAIASAAVNVIGLGCGGGQKDTRLLGLLHSLRRAYTPVDVSTAMVLVAAQTAAETTRDIYPTVCDLATTKDLAALLDSHGRAGYRRVLTFFGMMPNFEPDQVLPKLAALLRPGDLFLLSANLAPGTDYPAGVQKVLPLYHNQLTSDWLLMFLFDLGVERSDGILEWAVAPCPAGNDLLRISASFRFHQPRCLAVEGETFDLAAGDTILLFFSYRYTAQRLQDQLSRYGLAVDGQWITRSGEEGVFLAHKSV